MRSFVGRCAVLTALIACPGFAQTVEQQPAAPQPATPQPAAPQTAPQADALEIVFWESIRNSTNPADYQEYLKHYPNGAFAGLARNRLQQVAAEKPAPAAPKPPAPENKAMDLLPGLWISMDPDNQFQMQVTWNAGNRRFEGILVANGRTSARVGFSIGELIWVGTPTTNPDLVNEQQMYRVSFFGMSSPSWLQGTINLNNSNRNVLVTNWARFRRLQ